MSQISADTDAMQQVADALHAYAEEMFAHFDQVEQLWRDLPDHWQGNTAEQARADMRGWLNKAEESSNMAKFLGLRLLQAKRAVEETDLEGLNRL
jgi:WXG100 family type VII secretion target